MLNQKNVAEKLIGNLRKFLRLTLEESRTVEFIFWQVFAVEHMIKIIAAEATKDVVDQNFLDDVFDELTLLGKIKILEKGLERGGEKEKFKNFLSYLRKLNDIRNQIAHNKITNLRYNNKPINGDN